MKKFASSLFIAALMASGPLLSQDAETKGPKAATPPTQSTKELEKEAQLRIAGFKLPGDVIASLFVDSKQTQNPCALTFDNKGRMYIAEIHRWRAGVQDIRNEQQILFQDFSIETNEERLAMYQNDAKRPIDFYTEYEDRIIVVDDTNNDGRADTTSIFADGFNDVLDGPGIGLAFLNDSIYYTNIPHLWKLTDADGDGAAEKKESIQDGFGVRMSYSGHDMHGAIVGPDGKIYWSIGDRGSSITTKEGRHFHRPMEGGVFRCDPDGSNVEEIYRGLRNPQELAFDKYGNLFTCDNNCDAGDKGRLVYIIEGGESGWNSGHQLLINFRDNFDLRTPDLEHGKKKMPMNPWMTEQIWEPFADNRPEYALPAVDLVSWGPSGLVYNYGATAMPDRYANHFWVCNFGGAKGDLEAFSVKEKGAGFALDHHEIFMEGLGNTDVEFGPDGRMYLACFNNNGWYKQDLGNVYALYSSENNRNPLHKEIQKVLVSDFSKMKLGRVFALVSYPDYRVRQKAQFELVRRGEVDLLKIFATNDFAEGFMHPGSGEFEGKFLRRLHGIWGIGQLARKDESLLDILIPVLSDPHPEVRAQAAKTLADSRTTKAGGALVAALDDESARVKAFAAIGVGKCRIISALPKLQEILIANNNEDVFLRHACVQGMWFLNEREKILKLVDHESQALRLGVLLTLRKLEDPRVKYFLDDADQTVRYEAIRAINDLDLPTAGPALAAQIEKPTAHENQHDWMIHRRLINANFRVGTAECAERLVNYAARKELPELLRAEALAALEEWAEPTPFDPTVGFHRPLDPAKRADISDVVKANLSKVFDTVEGNLIAGATRVALKFGAEAPAELLVAQLNNAKGEDEARIGALRGLANQKPEALEPLWAGLLVNKKQAIRAAAAAALLGVKPDEGYAATLKLADSDDVLDRQSAFEILATAENPKAAEFIAERLNNIGKEKSGAKLDLIEAAEARSEEPVRVALAAYTTGLGDDPLAAFNVALHGGDKEKGATVFLTHAAGQCAKCHNLNGTGGVAGPDLSDIGKRHDAKYILESIVNPSGFVVPGYGMTMMSLKDGTSVGGAFLKEDDTTVTLKIPDPKDSNKTEEVDYKKSEIASRTPPISAMPPVGYMMTKSEVRDVVAYLAAQKKTKKEGGHK